MILVIALIGLVVGTIGYAIYQGSVRSAGETTGTILNIAGWTIGIVAAGFAIGLLIASLVMCTADEKIEMYQEENAKIEQQIADIVKNYQEYETDIFTELSPESAMTMITLYPELKSDKLVESQIEMYVKNNEQIKSLKEQLISRSIVNWWLYFGN